MTYDAREKSIQSGEPIEVYDFARGDTHWRYTSAKASQLYQLLTWEAALIQRNQIEHTAEKGRSGLQITCARDFAIADLYRVQPPSDVITVTLHRFHAGETSGAVIWMGRILNCEWSGSRAVLNCEPVSTSLARPGLRRLYQRQCPHVLYGPACRLDKADFAITATLTAASGVTIAATEFDAHPDGYFAGGFIEYMNTDGNVERRFITGHTGATLTINFPLAALAEGSQVTAYPGCDHALSTCSGKFANTDNYGGFPYIPSKNPFGGSALY